MPHFLRQPWRVPESRHTPESVYRARREHRREFLRFLGRAVAGSSVAGGLFALAGCSPSAEEIDAAGQVEPLSTEFAKLYPASRDDRFSFGRPETDRIAAAEYTNFFEFSSDKSVYQYVDAFQPSPWTVEVTGLCAKPRTFDLDDLYGEFPLEERAYRHRCVETWAMCVPWTGFALHKLLARVEPLPAATFVRFQTAARPEEMPQLGDSSWYPWPYTEGLTIAEALNELALVATGLYGAPLAKQHGAPVRLVLPWKYGYKSIKSIVRIELTDTQPETFWNTLIPHEYDFPALVDPEIPHPRWSQATEWMLGTGDRYDTVQYNGYGEYVGALYA
jgi:sulfoxide reductase catalytic subunit YedY